MRIICSWLIRLCGSIVVIVVVVQDSEDGKNRYAQWHPVAQKPIISTYIISSTGLIRLVAGASVAVGPVTGGVIDFERRLSVALINCGTQYDGFTGKMVGTLCALSSDAKCIEHTYDVFGTTGWQLCFWIASIHCTQSASSSGNLFERKGREWHLFYEAIEMSISSSYLWNVWLVDWRESHPWTQQRTSWTTGKNIGTVRDFNSPSGWNELRWKWIEQICISGFGTKFGTFRWRISTHPANEPLSRGILILKWIWLLENLVDTQRTTCGVESRHNCVRTLTNEMWCS